MINGETGCSILSWSLEDWECGTWLMCALWVCASVLIAWGLGWDSLWVWEGGSDREGRWRADGEGRKLRKGRGRKATKQGKKGEREAWMQVG